MENVLSGRYPISRYLYWYTAGEPTGEMKKLVDWVLGPEGQKLVQEVGYYPLPKAGGESAVSGAGKKKK
jgi:phosphate transport system substrate-binding protein